MTYREKGTTTTVATVAVPGLATAGTVDLKIVGNTSVPDPVTGGAHNYPLDEVTVLLQPRRCGAGAGRHDQVPDRRDHLVLAMSKAGIEVSNAGTTTPITATFSKFSVTAP